MANTTKLGSKSITITGLDANWSWETDGPFPAGIRITSIVFIPSATADRMIIRDGSSTGAEIFDSGGAVGTAPIFEPIIPTKKLYPTITIAQCTLGTAANAKVIIDFA